MFSFTQNRRLARLGLGVRAVAPKVANIVKQLGFYVDRTKSGVITSPTEVESGTIADDLQVVAQVVEMLPIRDHSRMKMDAVPEYESTHAQQFRLLPISHPEDWAAAAENFRRGDNGQGEPKRRTDPAAHADGARTYR